MPVPLLAAGHPLAGLGGHAERRSARRVVDDSVAVVVDAIARLAHHVQRGAVLGAGVARRHVSRRARGLGREGAGPGDRVGVRAARALNDIDDVVVDLAVAVVVHGVARLRLRIDRERADRGAARADRRALAARGARRDAGRQVRDRARFTDVRVDEVVVDRPVAVVVRAVAELGLGDDGLVAGDGPVGTAGGRAGEARAALDARGRVGDGAGLTEAGVDEVVVDESAAVVVDAVTRLGSLDEGQRADLRAILAHVCAELAGPLLTAGDDAGGSELGVGDVIVDDIVAVVVDTVARLRLRGDGGRAGQLAGLADHGGLRARAVEAVVAADSLTGELAVLGRVVDDVVAVVVDAIAGLRHRVGLVRHAGEAAVQAVPGAGGAGAPLTGDGAVATATGVALVGRTAAVVVEAVADLRRGRFARDAGQRAVDALLGRGRADPREGIVAADVGTVDDEGVGARVLHGRFVREAVAVVVLPVADLRQRARLEADALLDAAELADVVAGIAEARVASVAGAEVGGLVVDETVAVVVDVVADLGLGLVELLAGRDARDAVELARLARAVVRRVALGALQAVVDESVAVVVLTVADFGEIARLDLLNAHGAVVAHDAVLAEALDVRVLDGARSTLGADEAEATEACLTLADVAGVAAPAAVLRVAGEPCAVRAAAVGRGARAVANALAHGAGLLGGALLAVRSAVIRVHQDVGALRRVVRADLGAGSTVGGGRLGLVHGIRRAVLERIRGHIRRHVRRDVDRDVHGAVEASVGSVGVGVVGVDVRGRIDGVAVVRTVRGDVRAGVVGVRGARVDVAAARTTVAAVARASAVPGGAALAAVAGVTRKASRTGVTGVAAGVVETASDRTTVRREAGPICGGFVVGSARREAEQAERDEGCFEIPIHLRSASLAHVVFLFVEVAVAFMA